MVKIKRVKLNNKTRKGFYWYIKEEKKRGKYFKYYKDEPIETYLQAYAKGLRFKAKGVKAIKTKKKKHYYKPYKKRKLDTLIKKGTTSYKITKAHLLDRAKTKKSYKKLISPLIKEKELIPIITKEENINKFKYRIEAELEMSSQQKEIIIKAKTYGKTLTEIGQDTKRILNNKNMTEKDLLEFTKKGYQIGTDSKGIEIKGYGARMLVNEQTKITDIEITLKFRKGR